jgi:PAS domain S-box-containing protein
MMGMGTRGGASLSADPQWRSHLLLIAFRLYCLKLCDVSSLAGFSLSRELNMSDQPSYDDLQRRVDMLTREASSQNQALQQLEKENQSLRSLIELASLSNATRNLDRSLHHFADKARRLLGSDIVCIALIDKLTGDLVLGGWSDALGEDFRKPSFPVPAGGTGVSVMRTLQGVILEGDSAPDNLDAIVDTVSAKAPYVSTMVAPVSEGTTCLGVIYAFREPPFCEAQLNLLLLIGRLIGSEFRRRGAEEELKQSEERFRFMAETTGDVLYRLRYSSMQYDYLSPSIKHLTGYGQDEIEAIGFSRLVSRIDIPGHDNVPLELIRNSRLQGKLGEYRADYLIKTKQGGLKWVRDHSFPWVDESSEVVGSVGILSDVSDYKHAEARVQQCTDDLIESEEKYRTLVENVPLVVYRMGPRQEILFVNQFFQEVFGYSAIEVFRNPSLWTESVYEEDRECILELRNRCYEEGKEFFAEYRVIHKDGQTVYILDHAVPYRTYEGKVVSLDGIIVDMSDKVRLQDHLLKTQGIKTLNEISARLAHEIRNPLVSAGGFARLLLTHMSGDDPNRTRAEIIVKEVGRLEVILHMLLSYIKPLDLQICAVALDAMIEDVLSTVDSELRSKNIQLEVKLARGVAPVSVDPQQMERALEAIFRNAINQCRSGDTLRISAFQQSKTFVINIRYPKHHVSADDIEHFFYPFTSFAACQTTTDLPLSKIIINKHGGQAEVKLGENSELTVEITLPIKPDSVK